MGRRIVVGLEPSDYCRYVVDLAIDRAKATKSTLIGVVAVDLPGIEKAEGAAPAGAIHYGEMAVRHHVDHAQDTLEALLADFAARCKKEGVDCETEHHTGAPADVLADVALSADVLVIGARTFYHFESQPDPGDTLKRVLRKNVCPAMVLPKDFTFPLKRILIPYDGSRDSARAMRLFAYLYIGGREQRDVTLLHVDDDYDKSVKLLNRPKQYLESKGFNVTINVEAGDPKDKVIEVADEVPGTLVVLGAYGHGTIAEVLFGSTTSALIAQQKHALFIAA